MSVTTPQADVATERRQGRIVGIVGLLAVAVEFAAIILALSAIQEGPGGRATRGGREAVQYVDFDANRDLALLAAVLQVVGFLLIITVGVFLFRALRARAPETPTWLLWLGIAGPILVGVVALANYATLASIVTDFLDSGMRTNERAKDLADDSSAFRILGVVQPIAYLVVGAWMGLLCSAMMGIGMIPKFLGYYGYGAAIALVLAPFAGLALLLGWLGSVALILLGRWPGGQPPTWETGRAEPWT